jgi:competence ComEA-like helix-hairpin-helix protein
MKKYTTVLALAILTFVIVSVGFAATSNMANINGQININTATKDELMVLPYVNDEIAQNIIDVRSSNGPFNSLDDLLKVQGVDERLLNDVGSYLKVGGATTIRRDVK